MIKPSHRLLLQQVPAAVPCESQPVAQPPEDGASVNRSASNTTTYSIATASGPVLGVALVVLFATFFLIAFLSIYVRRLAILRVATDNASLYSYFNARDAGLDRATISNLPTIVYHSIVDSMTVKGAAEKSPTKDATATAASMPLQWSPRQQQQHSDYDLYECAVCLSAFEEGEVLRMLPVCRHCFHPDCIDMWLFSHSTCPLCRTAAVLLNPAKPRAAVDALQPPSPPVLATTLAI